MPSVDELYAGTGFLADNDQRVELSIGTQTWANSCFELKLQQDLRLRFDLGTQ